MELFKKMVRSSRMVRIMAKKRMFNNSVLDTDAFLDLPLSTQALYFHLNLRADDDGFISNPKRIQQYIGASEDDLKLLVLKSFVIAFDDGVIVIKHWRMHNTIRNDRYQPTNFQEDLALLGIKENKAYTLNVSKVETEYIPNGNQMETKCIPNVSPDIGLDLDIDKDIRVSKDTLCQTDNVRRVVDEWNKLSSLGIQSVSKLSNSSKRYKSLVARLKEYGIEDVLEAINNIRNSDFLLGKNKKGWQITFDWFVLPNNFPKVLEGNYLNKHIEQHGNNNPQMSADELRKFAMGES